MRFKVGSRKSPLALWQTHRVVALLQQAHPGLEVEIVTMDTLGDLRTDVPMPALGAKGLFTEELESHLLADSIDLAVHSLKDLPTQLPEGLVFAGAPRRGTPADAFISTRHGGLSEVPTGGTIATGSLRRKAQLLSQRPDLNFVDLRGNIATRLAKLEEHGWDGIIMAAAALERLGQPEVITEMLDVRRFVPAVSQGAIGIEARAGREDVAKILAPILDGETMAAVEAERHFLRHLEGGCSVPLGAHCFLEAGQWHFMGWIATVDGRRVLCEHTRGPDALALSRDMTEDFIARGARDILGRTSH